MPGLDAPPLRTRPLAGTRAVVLVAALALVGSAAFISLRAARLARIFLHPAREPITGAQRERAHRTLPGLVDVELRTSDGLVLRGWFSPGPRRDGIALVHGLWGNRASLLDEAQLLSQHGHGVLLFDSRASGESEGGLATWGDHERRDVRAAVDFLAARPDVDPARVGLYGFSVGSTAVALEAAGDPRVRAVALGPIWTRLDDELADKFPRGFGLAHWVARKTFERAGVDVAALDARAAVARIAPRPLFFISGSADADTPLTVMDKMVAAAPGSTRIVIPGAGHGGYAVHDAAALERGLAGFFDTNL